MSDRAAFVQGLDILAGLYSHYPSLPLGFPAQRIDLHQYGRRALDPAEQIGLAVAVIEQMDGPEISLHLNRGVNTAWLHVRGYLAGLSVTIRMFADDVCERRPEERRKRDRWVLPPEVVAAVDARPAAQQAQAVTA